MENQKVEGLITYSLDQQIFKFKVNNGNKESQETSKSDKLTSPEDNVEPDWTNDPTEKLQCDSNSDEFGDYINKSLSITPHISSTHNLLVNKHTTQWGVAFDFFPMKRHLKSWNPEGKFPHDPGGRKMCQLKKYLEKLFAI